MLQQLPRRMLEARRQAAAQARGKAVERFVDPHVRLFPVEEANEMIAEGVRSAQP